ncbi:Cell division protein FtsI (Penicillin-binding protein 3) [Candidatus Electrothrix laxa]
MLPISMIERFKRLFRPLLGKKKESASVSGYTYKLPGRPLQKGRKGLCLVSLTVLLVVSLGLMMLFPPFFLQPLQDLAELVKLPAGISKAIEQHEQQEELASESFPEEQDRPVLRGTIYDRNMEEMSVSYRLFSLLVQPAELSNKDLAAEQIASILDTEKQRILQRLQYTDGIITLADNLEIRQVEELEELHLPGIYCRPVEVRYYPDHTVAGQLLGFVSGNAGLSGVEALYDTVLEPGEFRKMNVPAVNFSGHDALGKTVADIILTIDIELQRQLAQILEGYRKRKGAGAGSAIVIDPDSGRVLAMVSQPGFDPNYFWQTDEQKAHRALFAPRYDQELLRPLLVQAAATLELGMDRRILPVTVSVPDYGLSEDLLQEYWLRLDLGRPIPDFLPVSSEPGGTSSEDMDAADGAGLLSPVQMIYGVATLLNSGQRVAPWFLNGLYDYTEQHFFLRDFTVSPRERIISPVQGIQLRQEILGDSFFSDEGGFLFADIASTLSEQNGLSVHHIQDLLLAAVPREQPEVLLLLTVDYGTLDPQPPEMESRDLDRLLGLGRNLLPILVGYGGSVETFAEPSPEKDPANLRRYFFSRKLSAAEVKENLVHAEPLMPSLIGLSLRKGLQQINRYNINVRIQGSGRIVDQIPAAGEPLTETEICELILEKEHD